MNIEQINTPDTICIDKPFLVPNAYLFGRYIPLGTIHFEYGKTPYGTMPSNWTVYDSNGKSLHESDKTIISANDKVGYYIYRKEKSNILYYRECRGLRFRFCPSDHTTVVGVDRRYSNYS